MATSWIQIFLNPDPGGQKRPDPQNCFKVSNSQTVISAKLKEFKIFDAAERTRFKMIAESTDSEVFDVHITLNNNLQALDL